MRIQILILGFKGLMANYATVKNRENDQISERYQRGNFNKQDPVVTKVYNTVHWINLYRAYNTYILHWI